VTLKPPAGKMPALRFLGLADDDVLAERVENGIALFDPGSWWFCAQVNIAEKVEHRFSADNLI
jgi:hypothetical protein